MLIIERIKVSSKLYFKDQLTLFEALYFEISTLVFDKILHYTKRYLLRNPLFISLTNFIFVVSHLKINPAIHLNSSKALTSSSQKKQFIVKSLLAFVFLMFLIKLKKDKMIAEPLDVQIEDTRTRDDAPGTA